MINGLRFITHVYPHDPECRFARIVTSCFYHGQVYARPSTIRLPFEHLSAAVLFPLIVQAELLITERILLEWPLEEGQRITDDPPRENAPLISEALE